MILDYDVKHYFQNILKKTAAYGGYGSLQIFRGQLLSELKDAVIGGCERHFTVFNTFGVIPKNCFECYKVAVEPHTIVDLFKLLMIFDKLDLPNNNTRKCMVERRDYCPGTYKGFVFCRGRDEGREIQNILSGVIADEISPKLPVNLKRGCSEFAAAYPTYSPKGLNAPLLEYNEDWQQYEKTVDNSIVVTLNENAQIEPYKPSEVFALQYWLRYAATIGDLTYLPLAGHILPPLTDIKRESVRR